MWLHPDSTICVCACVWVNTVREMGETDRDTGKYGDRGRTIERNGFSEKMPCSYVFPCGCPMEGCHRVGEDWISSSHSSKKLGHSPFSIFLLLHSSVLTQTKELFVRKRCIWLFFKVRTASDSESGMLIGLEAKSKSFSSCVKWTENKYLERRI